MSYIAIVDYGAGNLMSVHNTLDYLGYENKIAASADVIENAAGVILPGVGAFPDAMAALTDSGLTEAVLKAAKEKPFLGICLGMQMLFEESDEVRPCRGLGLLPGRIERIETSLEAAADRLECAGHSASECHDRGSGKRQLCVFRAQLHGASGRRKRPCRRDGLRHACACHGGAREPVRLPVSPGKER